MTNRTLSLDARLHAYLLSVSVREPAVLAELRQVTAELPESRMQIGPEQGQFMTLLIRLMNAHRCLEVGTFTGYSALCCALALPANGQLVTLDINTEWTAIARQHWEQAGVTDKIDLRIGPARHSLQDLLQSGSAGTFDFMFIDADKTGYAEYYELGLQLVRTGGLLVFDNVLWGGAVVDPADKSADTQALRELNASLFVDDRIELSMVPIGDGLTLARKLG